VDLSPRLVEILIHLASHPGQTITKEALLDRFWADVHVTDNTVTRAIADIRKALHDDPAEPQFIQTVARRGYRFIAELESLDDRRAASPRAADTSEDSDPFVDWVKGRLSLEALDLDQLPSAVRAFERAAAATPDYAPALTGLANAYFLQFELTRAQNTPDRDALTRAVDQARRACDLDPSLGEAWATLGFVLTAAGDPEHARAAARRAAALEPTSWRHHFRLAIATWGEERLRAIDRTLSLMPDFAGARFVAAMVFVARQAFPAAEEMAAKGAERQTREAGQDGSPFPAFGLHWLRGLLLMRRGATGDALKAFTSELEQLRDSQIYSRETRVNALIAAGHVHLGIRDAAGATEAFRNALALLPANGRALLGLHAALSGTGLAAEAQVLVPMADRAIADLAAGGRLGEAMVIKAARQAALDSPAEALATLETLLEQAPIGQVGWLIPLDPALAKLREVPGFERVLSRLAARAA
jgi:DNA-binding winged helix-turn-helix (wHTH) protein